MDYRRFYFCFLITVFSGFSVFATVQDSIGIECQDDLIFVLHRVESQETLYALSRRYDTPVASIIENNQITGNNLSVGSVIRVPWQHRLTHRVEQGETLYALSKKYGIAIATIKKINDLHSNELDAGTVLDLVDTTLSATQTAGREPTPRFHLVAPQETLYSLSKKYDVTPDDLRRWNSLEGNELKIGDTLEVKPPHTAEAPAESAVKSVATAVSLPAEQEKPARSGRPGNNLSGKPVTENGIAAVISGNADTRKYLALHPTAPAGTIMRVRNEMTNLSVFVRVVGQLPATGANNNVLIRLSPAAQEALGALDNRFRVELSYVPNQ